MCTRSGEWILRSLSIKTRPIICTLALNISRKRSPWHVKPSPKSRSTSKRMSSLCTSLAAVTNETPNVVPFVKLRTHPRYTAITMPVPTSTLATYTSVAPVKSKKHPSYAAELLQSAWIPPSDSQLEPPLSPVAGCRSGARPNSVKSDEEGSWIPPKTPQNLRWRTGN